ncbi:unnamed protein product [Vicia faba]|uniref:GAG-pre-integrase domain-containing protein n=1 Tax=Vicia faba TaxID=3906 RepID=A0AAV0ZSB0_VICFA|nr:unnamed protein product [Vicia faba]
MESAPPSPRASEILNPLFTQSNSSSGNTFDCWHIFDETFIPDASPHQPSQWPSNDKMVSTSQSDTTHDATSLMATHHSYGATQDLNVPLELDSHAWFSDSDIQAIGSSKCHSMASKVTSLEGAHDSDDLYRFFSLLVKKTTSSISGGIQVTSPTVNNDVQSQASTSSILSIWHRRLGHAHYEAIRFEESFRLAFAQLKAFKKTYNSTDKCASATTDPQALALMENAHQYSLPKDLENQAWFSNSGVSRHLTFNPYFLHSKKLYNGLSHVNIANGLS